MGCPPQTDLTRKLIRKYFKKQEGMGMRAMFKTQVDHLMKCWQKYGFNSDMCDEQIQKLRELTESKGSGQLKIEGKSLSQYCLDQLNPPIYPKHQKGRYKDMHTGYKPVINSIYDGLIMRKEIK